MPEAYGTHHSKMIIVFRRDDLAQVIILTGNFIERDWLMSQAIWRSPLLPLQSETVVKTSSSPLGSGLRFKEDILAYCKSYGHRLGDLTNQLTKYDFREVRAALIASTPSKTNLRSTDPEEESLWGWPKLKQILSTIPIAPGPPPHIVMQVSSVASVGEKWLSSTFEPALSTNKTNPFTRTPQNTFSPKFSLVFPTAYEIRRSIDGYNSGSSIHMKTQSAAQRKQLDYLHPMLCHWGADPSPDAEQQPIREAGRRRAAPHIKTYTRFSDASMTKIDWAMMTSANLSTQAWGSAVNASGEARICSYEIGLVVWPALWGGEAEMVPVFGTDVPPPPAPGDPPATRVAWRMPYDLPLVPYREYEMPWCATESCEEPDWAGRVWPGYGA